MQNTQEMQDTLLPDLNTSIKFWYGCYFLSNTFLLIASVVVIVLPMLTGADVVPQKLGFVSSACGALLAYLGPGGVSTNFIKARNDMQIAKYHYYTDKDREKLIAAYEKAKSLASYVPATPSTTDKGQQQPNPAGAQPPEEPAGAQPAEQLAGAQPLENLAGAQPLENLAGAQPLENLAGTQPAEQLAGAQPLENLAGAQPLENLAGAQPLENLAGTQPLEKLAGAQPPEKSS